MKTKIITFFLAMGIPISVFASTGSGCTGICGNCQFSCTPGVFACVVLGVNHLSKRYLGGDSKHA